MIIEPVVAMTKKPYISPSFSYIPLEETLQITPKKKQLFIGIPKETSFQENRVALTPEAVSVLVNDGHDVAVGHSSAPQRNRPWPQQRSLMRRQRAFW